MNSDFKQYDGKPLRHVIIEDRTHINTEDFLNVLGGNPNCSDDILYGQNIELRAAVLFARSHGYGKFADWLDEEFGLRQSVLRRLMTSQKFNCLV